MPEQKVRTLLLPHDDRSDSAADVRVEDAQHRNRFLRAKSKMRYGERQPRILGCALMTAPNA